MPPESDHLRWVSSELLPVLYDRSGMAGEQYRKMGLRIEALKETLGGSMRLVMVTSPLMGEGKTVTAANLALMLSREEGRRVLLVDCDYRKPRLWQFFRETPGRGLADVLLGALPFQDAVRRTEGDALDVLALPRGSDARIDPIPLERLRTVFREIRDRYDFVVCDTPPILPIADTVGIARMSDGLILVVRSAQTPRHALSRALEGIERNKLIGFVLNGVAERTMDRYYYRYHAEGGESERNGKES